MSKDRYRKRLNMYIRENSRKGHSLESIEKTLVRCGFEHGYVNGLIKRHRLRSFALNAAPVALAVALFVSLVFFAKPVLVGYTTVAKSFNFTDKVNFEANSSIEYKWQPENNGALNLIRLSGRERDSGSAKVYLVHENATYMVFDSMALNKSSMNMITGFAVREPVSVDVKGNLSAQASSLVGSLVADINQTGNNVEIEIESE